MTILTEDELKVWAINKSQTVVNTTIDIHKIANRIKIENKTDFLLLQDQVKEKMLYYYYQYARREHYYIDDIEAANSNCEARLKILVREKLVNHNRQVEQIDFNKPCSLMLYYIDNGFIVYHWESTVYLETLPNTNTDQAVFYEKQVSAE